MLETRGDLKPFVSVMSDIGCEYAIAGDHRVKLILQEHTEVRDIYKLAAKANVQIRRLSYKRDSLEDIFLKAMESGTV
jgi:ABC-2 type transport system ATP-binding protein